MSENPQYGSLRDYVRVLREQKWVIFLIVALFVGAATALSLRQTPQYRAEATLQFQNETEDLDLLGTPSAPQRSAYQLAAVGAQTVTSRRVAELAKEALDTPRSPDALRSAIGVRVQAQTNLVTVTATADNRDFAAALANAFAEQTVVAATRSARTEFRRAADVLRGRFRTLRRTSRDEFTRSLFADRVARLEFLAASAKPVSVTQPAAPPASAFSPRPVRNGLLGLILGLTVALVVAFARNALDRRLKNRDDIEEVFRWPVVGLVRERALGSAAGVPGSRATNLEPADIEAFRILLANLRYLDLDRPPRTLVVTSAVAEEGKSTVASSLALASAASGLSTLLIDCDLRRPTVAARLGISATPGLTDYLLGDAEAREVLYETGAAEERRAPARENGGEPSLLTVLPAGRPTDHSAELLGSRRFADLLSGVAAAYDLVILDTSPLLLVAETIGLITATDGALLCVRACQTTREQAKAAREALLRLPPRATGVVVTGLRRGDEGDFGYYSYSYSAEPGPTRA